MPRYAKLCVFLAAMRHNKPNYKLNYLFNYRRVPNGLWLEGSDAASQKPQNLPDSRLNEFTLSMGVTMCNETHPHYETV